MLLKRKRRINYAEENRCKPDLWPEIEKCGHLYVGVSKDSKERV